MQNKANDGKPIAYKDSRTALSRFGDKDLQKLQKWQQWQKAKVAKVAKSCKSTKQIKRLQTKRI